MRQSTSAADSRAALSILKQLLDLHGMEEKEMFIVTNREVDESTADIAWSESLGRAASSHCPSA
jgi:hypothetical protein